MNGVQVAGSVSLLSSVVEPRRADIPLKTMLFANVYGVDEKSYFHISFTDTAIQDRYQELYEQMEESTWCSVCLPRHQIQVGTNCVVEFVGRRNGVYVRGKIISIDLETETVRCKLIDDFREVKVHRTQIYKTNEAILQFPQFSLKCCLEGMECFQGHPFLRTLFAAFLQRENSMKDLQCSVEIQGNPQKEVPIVRLMTYNGLNLTEQLQELIPGLGKLEYPSPGVPHKVRIVYASDNGKMWFQVWGSDQLVNVVKRCLENFIPWLASSTAPQPRNVPMWKRYYIYGSGAINIAMHPGNDQFYRARISKLNEDGVTAQVFFIDYGHSATVALSNVYPAHVVDPNLCFIPPQCLCIQLTGLKKNSVLDVPRFWKYMNNQPVDLLLRDYGLLKLTERFKGLIVPEAEILIRPVSMSSEHNGFSLSETFQLSGHATAPVQNHVYGLNGNQSSSSHFSEHVGRGILQTEALRRAHNYEIGGEQAVMYNPGEETGQFAAPRSKPEEAVDHTKYGWVEWVTRQLKAAEKERRHFEGGPVSME